MTTSQEIEQKIDHLKSEYAELENQLAQSDSTDDSALLRLPAIKAKIGVLLKRIGIVKQDEQQAENEAKFAEFERLIKLAYAHYTRQVEIDSELKALAERQAELIAEKSSNRSNFHADKHKRIKLHVELNNIDRDRLNDIKKNYIVKGHLE